MLVVLHRRRAGADARPDHRPARTPARRRPTATRMALRRVGLLRYDRARAVYTLGPRIVELATSALAGLRIIKVAGPYMERLVDEVNETVVLSIWDGEAPVVVRVDDNTDRLVRINVRTGLAAPGRDVGAGQGVRARSAARRRRGGRAPSAGPAWRPTPWSSRASARSPSRCSRARSWSAAMAIVGTTASVQTDPGAAMCRHLRGHRRGPLDRARLRPQPIDRRERAMSESTTTAWPPACAGTTSPARPARGRRPPARVRHRERAARHARPATPGMDALAAQPRVRPDRDDRRGRGDLPRRRPPTTRSAPGRCS